MVTVDEHILKKYHPLLISMTSLAVVEILLLQNILFGNWLTTIISLICITAYSASIYFTCKQEKIHFVRLAGDIIMTFLWLFILTFSFNAYFLPETIVQYLINFFFIYWALAPMTEFCYSAWNLPSKKYSICLIFFFLATIAALFSIPFLFNLHHRSYAFVLLQVYSLICFLCGIASTLCIGKKQNQAVYLLAMK